MKTIRSTVDTDVDSLFKMVPSCCKCFGNTQSVKDEAFDVISKEVKSQVKEKLDNTNGQTVSEPVMNHIHAKLDPMFDTFDPNVDVGLPKRRRVPPQQVMEQQPPEQAT